MVDALQQVGLAHPPASGLRTWMALGRKLNPADAVVARQAAAALVSELFFKPLLAEMRKFPLGRELASGGQTESIFGEQLDQRIADSVATSQQGLVDEVVRRFGRVEGQRS